MKTKLCSIFSLYFLLSSSSQALEINFLEIDKFFIGSTIGLANYDVSEGELFGGSPGSLDNSDNYFKLFVGAPFNKYLGVEAGYVDLGELNFKYQDSYNYNVSAAYTGYTLNLTLTLPITYRLSAYGKAGVFSWEGKANSVRTGIPPNTSKSTDSASVDGLDGFYGLGVAYNWRNTTIHAEYEMYESDGDIINAFGIGASFNF